MKKEIPLTKKIRVIKQSEVEKEVKAGTVCLYYSSQLGGIFVPDETRKEILKGAEFCIFTDELTDIEKLARAFDDLKKEILKTWLGKFMLWILDRLSQMMNWIAKIRRK